jgi:hypothetical protein
MAAPDESGKDGIMKLYLATEPIRQEQESLTIEKATRRLVSYFYLRDKGQYNVGRLVRTGFFERR